MGLRTRIASWLLRSVGFPFPWIPPWQSGKPAWSSWSVDTAITEGYRAHAIIYACLRRISLEISAVPWRVKRPVGDGDEVVEKHPLAELLSRPNPRMSLQDMTEALILDLYLGGNGYWFLQREGSVQELWRLRPDRIKPIGDAKNLVTDYEYVVGSQKFPLPVRDDKKGQAVIHFRFFDPGDDLLGLAPLRAAARVVDTDNEALDWNKASLQNQARPPGALRTAGKLDQEQYDRLRTRLDENIAGAANARKPLLLEGGLEWQAWGMSPVDMDFLKGREWNAREICAAFGIHPVVLGLADANYENQRHARRQLWENTLVPLLADIRATLNVQLAPIFDPNLWLDYDLAETPAVQEARKELIEQAKELWAMGVPFDTINEQLGLGFEPIPGGDVGYLPLTMMPVGSEAQPKEKAGKGEEGRETRVLNLTTEEQRTTHWRAFDRRRLAWEKQIGRKVRERFGVEESAVLGAVVGGSWEVAPIITAQETEWEKLLLAAWQAVFEDFGEQAAEAFGMEIPGRSAGPDESRAVWDPWPAEASGFASQVVGEHVTAISTTTKLALRKEIQAALDAGEGTSQIAARIRGVYSGFDRHRSYVIARTEVGGAANYGTRSAAQQSGVVETHTWVSSRDERVRDSHRAIDGQTLPLTTRYSNGCLFPNDPTGPAAEVIQCRCVETFGTGV